VRPDVRVSDQLTEDAARLLADAATAGSHIALTGGSTPKAAYQRAAELELDWSRCELWFGDERCVEPDHEHSNFKMAWDALISKIEPRAVHRMQGELGPDDGALSYERELNGVFGDVVPALDLILLGVGPDGHCASLFPGNPELGIRDRWVAGVEQPGMAPFVPRITLTLPVLNAGKRVVFLVSGEEKAEAVARAFGSDRQTPEVPASLVDPQGEFVLLCDAPAAAHLER
jgi:6-phosphogluconolactonase